MSGILTPFLEPTGGATSDPTLPVPPIPPASPPSASTAQPNITSTRSPTDGVPQAGNRLWMRKWSLSVGAPAGVPARDLSRLDFEFNVEQTINVTPWPGHIKVWNISEDIVAQMTKELTVVSLFAGYQSPSKQYGKVFQGQIAYYKYGRANATDTFVEIFAYTNATASEAATVNTWLPVGWATPDAINALVMAMAPYGITLGQLPDNIDRTRKPRGRLMFGMARDYLRDIERTEQARFFIDSDGRLHLLRDTDRLKLGSETIPILNAKTGLVDVATQTTDFATELQCLLNPAITPGTRIQINNRQSVQVQEVNADQVTDTKSKLSGRQFNYKADGYYVVGHVRHTGQNRGNPWYSHIVTQNQNPEVQAPGVTTSV